MTSDRKRVANRANAQRSTGPRSREGKSRAAMNALRHGLNTAPAGMEVFDSEIEAVAQKFAQGAGGRAAAWAAAEAQAHLVRVRRAKLQVLQLAEHKIAAAAQADAALSPDEIQATALSESAETLLKLDGYERKALSRRKRALRALWE